MAETTLPPHVRALLNPAAYPHPASSIELRQTHISWVFIVDELVYKLKKPFDFGFLDYTTIEKRKHFCEEEVRLNSRMCGDTYLGVVPVVETADGFQLGGDGAAVDYAVKMRRLPEERMMSSLLARDAMTSTMLETLAGRIAEFHATAQRGPEIDEVGGFATVRQNWAENFEQTEGVIGRTITRGQFDDIRAFVDGVLKEDEALFAQRVAEGRVRDCHGDMRTDAVCFDHGGVCIYDCIEFNERFRYSDVASDIAFLAMDLEFRGRRDLSDELLSRYLAHTMDSTLPLLLPFYKMYRAYVRGKVDGFQLDQPDIDEGQKALAARDAQRYFELAHAYATQPAPNVLIVMIGVTGSGKSFLANALAAHIGAVVLSSDVTRKRLLGVDPSERHHDELDVGVYDPEVTERTYATLMEHARPWLEQEKSVILDATFLMRKQRAHALALAAETNAQFLAIECDVDDQTALERLQLRQGDKTAVSDGRWEIYEMQQGRREPVDDLPAGAHAAVDSADPLQRQIAHVLEHLANAAAG
jgi:aminoglycoside phosphotransferase family enzyme/predicted kinase